MLDMSSLRFHGALRPGTAPLFLLGLTAAATVLAACGGSGQATAAPPTGATASASSGQRTGAGDPSGARRFPGASGLVAEVDGTTLQVQGATSQTAVTWSATTRFTSEVAARRADVRAGLCVMVRSAQAPGQGRTPTAPTSLTAQTLTISQPVGGTCEAAFARGGPGRGVGAPGGQTGGPASGGPATGGAQRTGGTNGGRGFGGGFGGAFGTVTAVSANGFTVRSAVPTRLGGSSASASPTSGTTAATRVVTVVTNSQTTYLKTVVVTASAARVGTCVTALGTADETGAIAATSIAVRPAQNGSCTGGPGRAPGQGTATSNG
jgi:hypothetical protein